MLIATSHRRGQSLATVWPELDLKAGVLRPSRKLIRVKGEGLVLASIEDDAKGSDNNITLPQFAIDAFKIRKRRLAERRLLDPRPAPDNCEDLVFPSENWTPRDPNNIAAQWRRVRSALGLPDNITAHSFRKAVATILDGAGSVRTHCCRCPRARRSVHDSALLHGPWASTQRSRDSRSASHRR